MGSSSSWAHDKEDETKVCKHGKPSKYFESCMCDGCIADRSVAQYRAGMKQELMNNFSKFLDSLDNNQLQDIHRKLP